MELKPIYGNKINVSLIQNNDNEENNFPPDLINEVKILNLGDEKTNFLTIIKMKQKWILQHSTYVICSIYPQLYNMIMCRRYNCAYKQKGKVVFNIIDEITENYIEEFLLNIEDEKKYILQKVDEGESMASIGRGLNVPASTIIRRVKVISREIQQKLSVL